MSRHALTQAPALQDFQEDFGKKAVVRRCRILLQCRNLHWTSIQRFPPLRIKVTQQDLQDKNPPHARPAMPRRAIGRDMDTIFDRKFCPGRPEEQEV